MKQEKCGRPIVVDLFSGAGGLSLGFEQAGFDIGCSVEIDPIHAAVHKFNFPNGSILAKSVVDVTGLEIRSSIGLDKEEEIDVVVGGAPCQGFSLIGQRALDDPRNQLVGEYVRIVAELKPKYFVFENVKGLTVGKHKAFLDELIEELSLLGYSMTLPWEVLNAKDFGVPQNRERLFLIGARSDQRVVEYPSHKLEKVCCYEALSDLPDAEQFDELVSDDQVCADYLGEASDYQKSMRCSDRASWQYGYRRVWDPGILSSSRRTNHTAVSRIRFANTPEGKVEPISRFYKLSRSGVSNTLRAGTDSARGAHTSPRPIHYQYDRCVTVREMARLHGFPDWFRFHTTKWHGARQIGNSVPPPLAKAVAAEVIKALGISPSRPRKQIKLGDPDLLRLGMNEATAYFGLKESPIAKRERKEVVGPLIRP